MKRLSAALALAALTTATAHAQEVLPGVYDASAVPGWVYDAAITEDLGVPTWVQTGLETDNQIGNCNITTSEVSASWSDYSEYFNAMTPRGFAAQLAQSETVVTHAYLTAVFEMNGRPAMRKLVTTDVDGSPVDLVSVIIGGADTMVTISCGVPGGLMMGYLQPFQDFLEGISIETARPQ